MGFSLIQTFPFIYSRSERENAASERLSHYLFLVNTSSDPLFLSHVDFFAVLCGFIPTPNLPFSLFLGLFGPFLRAVVAIYRKALGTFGQQS